MAVRSISAKQLSGELHKALVTVTPKHKVLSGIKDPQLILTPWLIGFILREAKLGEQSLHAFDKAAIDVKDALPSVAGGSPATLIHNGHIIMGFILEKELTLFEPM